MKSLWISLWALRESSVTQHAMKHTPFNKGTNRNQKPKAETQSHFFLQRHHWLILRYFKSSEMLKNKHKELTAPKKKTNKEPNKNNLPILPQTPRKHQKIRRKPPKDLLFSGAEISAQRSGRPQSSSPERDPERIWGAACRVDWLTNSLESKRETLQKT